MKIEKQIRKTGANIMNISAIILAAGKGSRMKKTINKQFLEIEKKPILSYTIEAFLASERVKEIILVINPLEEDLIDKKIIRSISSDRKSIIHIAYGGQERYNSVYNGLKQLGKECQGVLIHDGARPLISKRTIEKTIDALSIYDGCLVGVKAKDTYKMVDANMEVKQTIDRQALFQIQTPQAFKKEVIMEAYEKGQNRFEGITDDGMMVEQFTNYKLLVIEGEYSNIKITTPDDLELMKTLLKNKEKI